MIFDVVEVLAELYDMNSSNHKNKLDTSRYSANTPTSQIQDEKEKVI